MKEQISKVSILADMPVLEALKLMDKNKSKLLIVLENDLFLSLLSIGDIQRAIIANKPLNSPVKEILRKEVKVASESDKIEDIKSYMRERRNEFIPIIKRNGEIVDVIFWNDVIEEKVKPKYTNLNLPVIIMAGGQGSRLRPLTNILPKPLIPIGEQTILEDIMDKFTESGCHEFYISVNYKAETIKRYFDNLNNSNYNISYFQENMPLGTAGSLHLLKGKIKSTFFVSNCDILIDQDYSEILKYHKDNNNEITMVAAIKNLSIPYGTLETSDGGVLQSLKEKPDFTYKINTGLYILEPHLIDEIPQGEFYHITFLIEKLIKHGRKVGVFPINEGSWTDIGNWEEYFRYINKK